MISYKIQGYYEQSKHAYKSDIKSDRDRGKRMASQVALRFPPRVRSARSTVEGDAALKRIRKGGASAIFTHR